MKKIFSFSKYLRLSSFDVETEQGRADERYRLALWSMIANGVSKSFSMLVVVLGVRWTIPYLGAERFGVWMTIASISGILSFLDLGIGNALTNHVARAVTEKDRFILQRAISGGLGILLLLGVVVGLLLLLVSVLVPWDMIIKGVNPSIYKEVSQSLVIFSCLFGLNLFTLGIQRVFVGLQRAFETHITAATGSLLSLVILWLATKNRAGIPVLLSATFGVQTIVIFFLLPVLVSRDLLRFSRIKSAILHEKDALLKVGGMYFILQLVMIAGWGADSLIIASALGATQVAVYNVTQRLFQFVTQPLLMMNSPLWASYADAGFRGDTNFIRKTLKRSLLISAGVTLLLGGGLVIGSKYIFSLWTNGAISVPLSFVLSFFLWTLCYTVGDAFAMFMNGCGIIKPQVLSAILFAILVVPLKVTLVHLGIEYILISTIISYIIATPLFYWAVSKREIISAYS
ncbi:MATE family efflux transporter [Chlorobaculum sp. 24CR]|uniref:lipopolysaccharide biosynthesis protein n=1 Tax=Chlorobaculum sp. 24CR TaxID=2508878 RepID=UPI00100B928E|nr:MATE family efflux transporter [Chlorobaculum sp. 24CR]RXK81497.1 MATE family efflux transporter [Chlorobaculum sp. 24CR]